jgi:hypothetical protein
MKYRIDRTYEKVYEWNVKGQCYQYLTSFAELRADKTEKDRTIYRKIAQWRYEREGY